MRAPAGQGEARSRETFAQMAQVPAADLSQAMFDLAPVSLWLEDYSSLKTLFARWRAAGVTDLRALFRADPAKVGECADQIRILSVNAKTNALFESRDLQHLTQNLDLVFRADMMETH